MRESDADRMLLNVLRCARPLTAVATLVALSACQSAPAPEATVPLAPGTSRSPDPARCVVADPEGELILQPGSLSATGDGMTLGGVELQNVVNLEVIETDTVAFSGSPTVRGIILDYPPMKNAGLADSLADWDQRKPLEGRHLSAADGQTAVLVVLRLSDPGTPGHLSGVQLDTSPSDGSRVYPQPVLVKPHGEPCTTDDIASTKSWIG